MKTWGKIGIGALAVAMLVLAGGVGALLGTAFHTCKSPAFHTVSFSFNNRTVSTQTVADGKTATAPYLPATVTDHNNYEYDFVGWTEDGKTVVDPSTVTVTDDVNYAALFKFTGYVVAGTIPNEYVGTYDIPENNKISGQYVWQYTDADDVEHVYYSYSDQQYKLAADGISWEPQAWEGLTKFQGNNIWQHNGDVYYSSFTSHYKLAADGVTWVKQTWTGLTRLYGESVWQHAGNVYYSTGNNQYKLDAAANNWVPQTWAVNQLSGKEIWQHNGNLYYSFNGNQYKLDTTANDWVAQTWEGLTEFFGSSVWQYNGNVYYSDGDDQYKLATDGKTWQPQTWVGLANLDRKYVWQHNGSAYYSYNNEQYKLADDGVTWQRFIYPATGKLDAFSSSRIWHANGNTYYDGYQFKNGKWVLIDWQLNGLSLDNLAAGVWQLGDAVYYSNSNTQYKLADDGLTWQPQTWTGLLHDFTKDEIWQHDGNVYYSYWGDQYKLDVAKNRWEKQTWQGELPYFLCENVWQCNGNVYYSYDKAHYKLAVDGITWEEQTWTGLASFKGSEVFAAAGEIYVKSNGVMYRLVGDAWQSVPLKQIILDQTNFCTIGNASFFGYKGVKYILKDLYYCPELKVDNYYVNDRSLDPRND